MNEITLKARLAEAERLLEQSEMQISVAYETARRKDWQAEPYTVADAFDDLDDLSRSLQVVQNTIRDFLEGGK